MKIKLASFLVISAILISSMLSCIKVSSNVGINTKGGGTYDFTYVVNLTMLSQMMGESTSVPPEEAMPMDADQLAELKEKGFNIKETNYKENGNQMYSLSLSFSYEDLEEFQEKLLLMSGEDQLDSALPIKIERYDWGSVLISSTVENVGNSYSEDGEIFGSSLGLESNLEEMVAMGIDVSSSFILKGWNLVKTNAPKVETKDDMIRLTWSTNSKMSSTMIIAMTIENKESAASPITRAQAITQMYNLLKDSMPATFSDVKLSDCDKLSKEEQDAIKWAIKTGVSNGVGSDSKGIIFNPGGTLTREQAYCMLYKKSNPHWSRSDAKYNYMDSDFADLNKVNLWAIDSLRIAKDRNALVPKEKTLFGPQTVVSKSDWASILATFMALNGMVQ